jgi:hypothetical protein
MRRDDPSIMHARHLLHAISVCDPSFPGQVERVAKTLQQPLDWPYALERGTRHKLLPWFNHILEFVSPDIVHAIPHEARRHLMVAALNAEATCRKQTSLVKTVLETFAQRGLPVMVVKGLTLAALYPKPSLRPSGDIDLIVKEHDWPAVANAMNDLRIELFAECKIAQQLSPESVIHRASYFPHGQICYRAPCGTVIEVHFRLLNIGIPTRTEDAWKHSRIQSLGELSMPTINREDAILFQILHMQGHHFAQLIWFTDLCAMLKAWNTQLDWSEIKSRVRQWRIEHTVAYVFELLQDLGASLPKEVSPSGFQPPGRIQSYLFRRRWPKDRVLEMEQEPPFGASIWLYLRQRASWLERCQFVWRVLFPPRACLGSESRRAYWTRFLGQAIPTLQKYLHVPKA